MLPFLSHYARFQGSACRTASAKYRHPTHLHLCQLAQLTIGSCRRQLYGIVVVLRRLTLGRHGTVLLLLRSLVRLVGLLLLLVGLLIGLLIRLLVLLRRIALLAKGRRLRDLAAVVAVVLFRNGRAACGRDGGVAACCDGAAVAIGRGHAGAHPRVVEVRRLLLLLHHDGRGRAAGTPGAELLLLEGLRRQRLRLLLVVLRLGGGVPPAADKEPG